MDARTKQIDTKGATADTPRLHLPAMICPCRGLVAAGRGGFSAALTSTGIRDMTTFRKHLLSTLTALSLGAAALAAQAQSATPDQAHTAPAEGRHGHAASQEKRAEFAARRAARLHDELKITPAQENAWNAFVASMRPAPRGARPQAQAERTATANLSAPQRLAQHIERQKRRTAAMEQRLGAVNSFYAVLTPEQKKTFDEKAARMQGRFGKHGGRGGHGGGQGGDATARG
jgi:protein CpxP